MENITLEEIRDGYKEIFLRNLTHVELLVTAGSITCLIEDIEKTAEQDNINEQDNILTQ